MPRPLKPRKRGQPRQQADPEPELVEALSLAGLPRGRIAELLGLSVAVLDLRYAGHLRAGPKMPTARVATLLRKLIQIAEGAKNIPNLIAVIRLLAPLHLPELAKSWAEKQAVGDLPPVAPELGHDEPPA